MKQKACVLACLFFGGIGYVYMHRFLQDITTIATHELHFDAVFSPVFTQEISAALARLPGSSVWQYQKELNELCATYPSIALATLSLDQKTHALITITAALPQCLINNTYCITGKGLAFTAKQLQACFTESITSLIVTSYDSEDALLNQSLVAWLHAVPANIFATYTVEWHNKTAIILYPKKQPTLRMLCTHQTVLTDELFETVMQLTQKQYKNNTGRMALTADLRFSNQIIITKNRLSLQSNNESCLYAKI